MVKLPLLAMTFVAGSLCAAEYTVETGTKLPLSLINSVSTRHSVEGDRVYLETVFPVLVNGRIVVPVGSYVAGTAAGMAGVLLSRGPDAVLAKGSTLEMVLDRPVTFQEEDLNFGDTRSVRAIGGSAPQEQADPSRPMAVPLPRKK